MARLVGVDLPRDKRMEIALTYIYGIGKTHAKETLAATGVSPDLRAKDLTDEDLLKLRDYIDEHFRVEGDLRREVAADIRRKVEIGCYQGLRHRRGLPVHGQRTKTNARSSKGLQSIDTGKDVCDHVFSHLRHQATDLPHRAHSTRFERRASIVAVYMASS